MATYKIYMVKLGNPQIGNQAAISTRLKAYFDQVIHANHNLSQRFSGGAEVSWPTGCPHAAAHELIIYVLGSSMDTVVSYLPGLSSAPNNFRDDGLTTWVGTLSASEIYTSRFSNNADMLAKIAFHEAMHNKTHNNNLHTTGGLAASPLTSASTLTQRNIRMMASALTSQTQWTGGCDVYNDPLRGM